jgi:hypothetical protein
MTSNWNQFLSFIWIVSFIELMVFKVLFLYVHACDVITTSGPNRPQQKEKAHQIYMAYV